MFLKVKKRINGIHKSSQFIQIFYNVQSLFDTQNILGYLPVGWRTFTKLGGDTRVSEDFHWWWVKHILEIKQKTIIQ